MKGREGVGKGEGGDKWSSKEYKDTYKSSK